MSTIIEKLNEILAIKNNIKYAIRDKGINIPDYTPFAEYPKYIRNISGGGNNGGDKGGNNNPGSGSGLIRFKAAGEMPQKDSVIRVNEREYTSNQLFYVDDIYGLDVGEPITQLRFYSNSNISEIVELDVSNITNMNDMFNGCTSLRHVNASDWVTPNVREANGMFFNCAGLEAVEISNWDTSGMKSRHIITLYTDEAAHPLGFGSKSNNYPSGMAKNMSELTAWWDNPQIIKQSAKRLLLFAPDTPDWNYISYNWGNVIHYPSRAGQGLSELDFNEIISVIANSI